jgi:hypothetical protein
MKLLTRPKALPCLGVVVESVGVFPVTAGFCVGALKGSLLEVVEARPGARPIAASRDALIPHFAPSVRWLPSQAASCVGNLCMTIQQQVTKQPSAFTGVAAHSR